ncbi:phosphatase PAP2 family protein [Donghicola sp.]|uniref:phosphatase PAP2 family protein n=1 Tax=Donghicola sp. TaxID=1929294 RepID=UPI002600D2A6|nr:phosphatase PAP2 family protein [Donghicola sp.]MCT4578642.1 phosphatase PAP2 family protein [Donghicola sp.]
MSDALIAARGGVVGYWSTDDITDDSLAIKTGKNWSAFRKLAPEVRAGVLDSEVMDGFSFDRMISKVPAPDPLTRQDFEKVRRAADLRADRLNEIYAQQKDMMSFFGALFNASGARFDRTIEFIDALLRLCIPVEMRCKYEFGRARPVEIAPEVMPIIQTPGHGSYPSGHAVESMAIASALEHFSEEGSGPKIGPAARAMARRIAFNRVVAGVHYESDNAGGEVLGEKLFKYIRKKAKSADDTPLALLYEKALEEWR